MLGFFSIQGLGVSVVRVREDVGLRLQAGGGSRRGRGSRGLGLGRLCRFVVVV